MNETTLKYIIQAFNTTSSDMTRIHLGMVNVKAMGQDRVRIQATDGRKATQVMVFDKTFSDLIGDKELNFNPEYLSILKTVVKSYKRLPELSCELIGNDLMIQEIKIPMVIDKSLAEYPDVDRVMPKTDNILPEHKFEVGFNAEYLMDILKAMQEDNKQKIVKLTFNTSNNRSEILVQVGNNESRAVLMPCRI